jgi:hypothetical protein
MNSIYNTFHSIEYGCTPYGITNCLLSNFSTRSNIKNMFLCLKFYNKYAAPIYGKYVVYQSPMYMKALIKHPFYIQLLSFSTIGLHIRNQNWCFNIGKFMEISLLNSPWLC